MIKIRNETRVGFHTGLWLPPTPAEIQEALQFIGRARVATLCGVHPRTVRKWLDTSGGKSARVIGYAEWRLILLYLGWEL